MHHTSRRAVILLLILLLALPLLLSGCGSSAKYKDIAEKLSLMEANITQTEAICGKLTEIADWQIKSSEESWKEYDEAFKNGTEGQLPDENNDEEVQAKYDELKAESDALAAIETSYSAGEATGVAQFDETEQAYLSYIADIRRSADDMQTMFQYYFNVRDAIKPMEEYEPVESTTGYTDYSLIAGQLSQVISQTQKSLGQIDYPTYMKGSHDALLQRMTEYQGLSQDLSEAMQLSDPLRMASWFNRVSRLDIMLNECSRDLDDDFNLQFGRARDRVEGRVASLRSELQNNISALLNAIG
jgi:hypothetical protein